MKKNYLILFLLGAAAASILVMQQRCPESVIAMEHGQQATQLSESEPIALEPHIESVPLAEQPEGASVPYEEVSVIPVKNAEQAKKQITVKNGITEKMITYPKGFMHYVPEFSVTVNDVAIEQGKQADIILNDDKLVVEYRYNFYKGYKIGMRRIEFIIPEDQDAVTLNFSWKDDWRVIIPGAQPNKILAEES